MTPIEASKKLDEKLVFSKHRDKRRKQKTKQKLENLVRTAALKRVVKGILQISLIKYEKTNWSLIRYNSNILNQLFAREINWKSIRTYKTNFKKTIKKWINYI